MRFLTFIDRILDLFPRRKVDFRMDEQTTPAAGSTSPSTSTGSIQPAQPASDPQVIEMRERSIVEGILANESLTSDLDDEAAQELIDWSIAMAHEAVQQTAGMDESQAEKAISERMYTQRKLMRSVKRLVVEKDRLDGKSRDELLDQIQSQSKAFYGDVDPQAAPKSSELLETLREPGERPGRAVARLRRMLDPHRGRPDDRPSHKDFLAE